MKKTLFVMLVAAICVTQARAAWFDELIEKREAAPSDRKTAQKAPPLPDFGTGEYTFAAWVLPEDDGTIVLGTAPPRIQGPSELPPRPDLCRCNQRRLPYADRTTVTRNTTHSSKKAHTNTNAKGEKR